MPMIRLTAVRMAEAEAGRVVGAEARAGGDEIRVGVLRRGERQHLVQQVAVVLQVAPGPRAGMQVLAVPALAVHLVQAEELDPALVDVLAEDLVHPAVGPLVSRCRARSGNASTRAPAWPKTSRLMSRSSEGLCQPVVFDVHGSHAVPRRNGSARANRRPQERSSWRPQRDSSQRRSGPSAVALAQEEIAHPAGVAPRARRLPARRCRGRSWPGRAATARPRRR